MRKRIRIKEVQMVTSSDRKRAFYINEININMCIDTKVSVVKRPYIKVFGEVKFIAETEISVYVEHGCTIYYK